MLLFNQYRANDSLPGSTDSIYNLSIFKDYGNRVAAFINNEDLGNALYPEKSVQQFAELYIGEALIFNFFDLFVSNDIFCYYLFLSFLFALNGWSAYLLAFFFFNKHLPAIVAGLILASSSFAFSQIELLNGIPFAPLCLSLLFFLKYLKASSFKYLIFSSIFAAIQFYFSNYIFVYLIVSIIAIQILTKWTLLLNRKTYYHYMTAGLLGVLLLIPYGIISDWGRPVTEAVNPINLELIKKFSLGINDFWRHLPQHRIYNFPQAPVLNETMKNVNFAFLGFVSYLFIFFAFLTRGIKNVKVISLIIMSIGLFFALGPYLSVGNKYYIMPMYSLYDWFDLQNYLRIPPRAFSLVILGGALLIASFLTQLSYNKRVILSLIFLFLFFIENVPERFYTFKSAEMLSLPSNLNQIPIKEVKAKTNMVFIPSSLLSGKAYNEYGVSEFSREYTYSYWQTKIKVNVINGTSGFFPKSRLDNNELLKGIMKAESLEKLIELNSLNYIVIIKRNSFILNEEELKQTNFVYNYPNLTLISETRDAAIFKVKL